MSLCFGMLLAVIASLCQTPAISLSEVLAVMTIPVWPPKTSRHQCMRLSSLYWAKRANANHSMWMSKPGYYAYRDKLTLQLPDGVTATPLQFGAVPTYVDDPDFGRVPVFEQPFTATTTLSADKAITSQPATVKWQGCAKVGLCYPLKRLNLSSPNWQLPAKWRKKSDAMTSKTAQAKVTNTVATTNDAARQRLSN